MDGILTAEMVEDKYVKLSIKVIVLTYEKILPNFLNVTGKTQTFTGRINTFWEVNILKEVVCEIALLNQQSKFVKVIAEGVLLIQNF